MQGTRRECFQSTMRTCWLRQSLTLLKAISILATGISLGTQPRKMEHSLSLICWIHWTINIWKILASITRRETRSLRKAKSFNGRKDSFAPTVSIALIELMWQRWWHARKLSTTLCGGVSKRSLMVITRMRQIDKLKQTNSTRMSFNQWSACGRMQETWYLKSTQVLTQSSQQSPSKAEKISRTSLCTMPPAWKDGSFRSTLMNSNKSASRFWEDSTSQVCTQIRNWSDES